MVCEFHMSHRSLSWHLIYCPLPSPHHKCLLYYTKHTWYRRKIDRIFTTRYATDIFAPETVSKFCKDRVKTSKDTFFGALTFLQSVTQRTFSHLGPSQNFTKIEWNSQMTEYLVHFLYLCCDVMRGRGEKVCSLTILYGVGYCSLQGKNHVVGAMRSKKNRVKGR